MCHSLQDVSHNCYPKWTPATYITDAPGMAGFEGWAANALQSEGINPHLMELQFQHVQAQVRNFAPPGEHLRTFQTYSNSIFNRVESRFMELEDWDKAMEYWQKRQPSKEKMVEFLGKLSIQLHKEFQLDFL